MSEPRYSHGYYRDWLDGCDCAVCRLEARRVRGGQAWDREYERRIKARAAMLERRRRSLTVAVFSAMFLTLSALLLFVGCRGEI